MVSITLKKAKRRLPAIKSVAIQNHLKTGMVTVSENAEHILIMEV
jgi:hypothetical protein